VLPATHSLHFRVHTRVGLTLLVAIAGLLVLGLGGLTRGADLAAAAPAPVATASLP
jgi:hypothetical protein